MFTPRTPTVREPLKPGAFITKTVKLVRPLAEGGMGCVWIAEHLGLASQVVVKVMAEEMTARPDGAERFTREAAVAAAIKSPHVVQVFDHGLTASGVPYIVMELLEGRDLGAHLSEHGRMEPSKVVSLVVQVGKALSKAHKASIVHRDIKPDNIFLCDTDAAEEIFVKLLDFGTAKREDKSGTGAGGGGTSRTTIPGQIMGTPYYMSPEQSVGAELDERSDIWSLGVVAFEALTGRKPFDGSSIGAITIAIHGVLPRMSDLVRELPTAVDDWFARACAQRPQDRFSSAREATNAFVEAVTGSAPMDQPTESVCFPPVKQTNASNASNASNANNLIMNEQERSKASPPERTPDPHPVVRPLIATLPQRGEERRVPTIAAGVVVAMAAIAMLAIVLNRAPSSSSSSSTAPSHTDEPPSVLANATTHAAEIQQPPAPLATPPYEPEPSLPPPVAKPTAAAVAPVAKPAAKAAAKATAPSHPISIPSANAAKKTAPGADDDLVRLTNAAAKHSSDPPAPTSAAPAPAPTPAPAPSPKPENNAPPPPLPSPDP